MKPVRFVFTWPLGNYGAALGCYFDARMFMVGAGFTAGRWARKISGTIQAPDHPKWDRVAGDLFVPQHLIDDEQWITRALVATDDEATYHYIKSVGLPDGVTRTEDNEVEYSLPGLKPGDATKN